MVNRLGNPLGPVPVFSRMLDISQQNGGLQLRFILHDWLVCSWTPADIKRIINATHWLMIIWEELSWILLICLNGMSFKCNKQFIIKSYINTAINSLKVEFSAHLTLNVSFNSPSVPSALEQLTVQGKVVSHSGYLSILPSLHSQ